MRRVAGRGEEGSATVLMLGVGLSVALIGIGFATAGAVFVAQHRAANAADAGALAGALYVLDGADAACSAAGRLVGANEARLVSCTVAGVVVTVVAEVRTRTGLVGRASARAGAVVTA